MTTEEDIMAALFALVEQAPGIKTAERRLKLWADVPPSARPALFLYQRHPEYVRQEPAPAKVTLNADIFIYTSPPAAGVPGTLLNQIVAAVRATLAPSPMTGLLTLGGLVSHCWIEGNGIFEPGDLDGDGLATLPIKILVPTLS